MRLRMIPLGQPHVLKTRSPYPSDHVNGKRSPAIPYVLVDTVLPMPARTETEAIVSNLAEKQKF